MSGQTNHTTLVEDNSANDRRDDEGCAVELADGAQDFFRR